MGQPHFVLSEVRRVERHGSLTVHECGRELARDVVEVPAMAHSDNTGYSVFIRLDSIGRYLWQSYEEWTLHKNTGPKAAVIEYFGWQATSAQPKFEAAADQLACVFRAHERGEIAAAAVLEPQYRQALATAIDNSAEFYLRAVRDLLADSLHTWPMIVESGDPILLNYYLADIRSVRQLLLTHSDFPLPLNEITNDASLKVLASAIDKQKLLWTGVAQQLVADVGTLKAHELEDYCVGLVKGE